MLTDRLEALRRHRNREQVIKRDHGEGKKFKFSLSQGEHVIMAYKGEGERLFRVTGISCTL